MTNGDRIRVLVADDDAAVREALVDLIEGQDEMELVGSTAEHAETVQLAARLRPDVVLMDVRMPRGEAPDSARAIRARAPGTRVLALSAYEDISTVVDMLAAGAVGYLVKGASAEEILAAISRAVRGQLSLPAYLAEDMLTTLGVGVHGGQAASAPSEQSYRELLDNTPVAVLVVGPADRIELANAGAERWFGYPNAELLKKPITELIAQESLGVYAEAVAAAGGAGEPRQAGLALLGRRRDGSEFPAQISVSRMHAQRQRLAVYLQDVSDLRQVENRFRQMIESSPDALVMVDTEGRIQLVNEQTERLFGWRRGELLGQAVERLMPGHPLTVSVRDTAGVGGEAAGLPVGRSLELVGRRRDGSEFPADVGVSELPTGQGALAVMTIRDVTEVQRAQLGVEQSLELLRMTSRDRQYLLKQLVRAQEEERSRIAAGIHDDTIQVVTAATLRLQQLRRRLQDPEQLSILAKLDETLTLSLSRLRQLIFDLRPPALDRGNLVDALQAYLKQLRAETGVEFRLEDRLEREPSTAARVLVYRIAQEALVNVRKHAEATRARVQLLGVDEGILIRITDNGVGYNPGEVESRPGHLGIMLMHERAETAGGWCRIESAPGAGTTVEAWVPAGEPAESREDARTRIENENRI